MLDDFPFISLWNSVSDYTTNGGDIEQSTAVESLIKKHKAQLLNPNPFAASAASRTTNKNELLEGKVAGSENISQPQRQALVDMIEELDITVDQVMKCWTAVSDDRTRRILESELGMKIGDLDRNLPGAARSLYFYNHSCLLLSLRQLLQSRYHTGLPDKNRALVIKITNDLLRSGLISELIKTIGAFTERSKQRPSRSGDTSVDEMQSTIAECLFFACYETQIEIGEAQLLLDAIKLCSEQIMFDRESSSFSTSDGFSFTKTQHASMSLLIVLLCAFACGLSQTREFLTRREVDNEPVYNGFVGNSLAPPEGVAQGTIPTTEIFTMHERIYSITWENKYVQGFVRLVWSLFCAASDEKTLEAQGSKPPIDPFKVLDKALRNRVFSFIAKCLCPARQFFYEDQQQLLYLDVLSEVLENTLNLIALDISNAQQSHGFSSSARHIQLLSRAEWISNRASARQMTGEIRRHASADEDLDCWDEILDALAGFAKLNPQFAEKIWPRGGTTPPHPILESAVECMDRDDTLLVPVLNLLSAFAAAPNSRIACAVYNFVRGLARNWMHYLWCIHSYVVALGGEVQGSRTNRLADAPTRTQLRPEDVTGLIAIVNLFDKVLADQHARDSLFRVEEEALAPIPNLFALAACHVPPELKGAIFCAIGRFAQHPEATPVIWRLMEEYQIVPSGPRQRMVGAVGGIPTGIVYELEQVEARQGSYPATEGFLVLLHSLMSCSIPSALGEGYRRPGILPYLAFVLDHVLMRCTGRHYDVQHHGEVWRIAALAVKIFLVVLQSYHINSLPTVPVKMNGHGAFERSNVTLPVELEQFELDFHEERASGLSSRRDAASLDAGQEMRTKTAQFEVMNWMLSESKLLQCVEEFIAINSIKDLAEMKQLQREQGVGRALLNMQRFHEALAGRLRVAQRGASAVTAVLQDPGLIQVDTAYWKERLVLVCIGLLYETSIREDRFIHRVSQARDLVATTLNAETGWEEQYAVQVQHLPYLLASHTRLSPLPVLAHFIQYSGPASEIPIMVSKILEHTGKVLNANDLLATIRAADHQLLVTGCVRRLMMEDTVVETSTVLTSADADDRIVTFSGLNFERDQATKLVDEQTAGAITMEQYAFGSTNGTPAVREAILDLLLGQVTSTTPATHATLAHVLLGLENVLAGRSVQLSDPRPGHPVNCLEAVFMMLDLPDTSPRLAEKGFQLIYRLCASPLTMTPVLGLLRKRSVDFIQHHLQKFLLLGPANMYSSGRDTQDSIRQDMTDDAHVCRQLSCAWLLKVTALEFRSLTASESIVPHKAIQLLAMLFAEGSMPSLASRQPEIALVQLLDAITVGEAPTLAVHNSLVLQCMQQSYVPLSKEPELQQYSAIDVMTLLHNIRDAFPPAQAPPTSTIRSQVTAVAVADQLPKVCSDAVTVAVSYNKFTRQLAAAGHFHYAWWQVVSVSLMGCGKLLLNRVLGGDISNGLRHIVNSLLDPILHILAESPSLQMPIAEPLAKTAVAIMNFVRTAGLDLPPIFTLDQTLTFLELVIQSILRRGGAGGGALESSPTYRGHMYAFFVHLLRYLQLSGEAPASAQPAATTGRLHFGTSSDPAAQLQHKVTEGCVQILEAYAEALVVRVCPDLTQSTPCWRALAMSCMSTLFSGLALRSLLQTDVTRGSEYANAYGSTATHHALDALFDKGHLQVLLLAIHPERSSHGEAPDVVHDELSVSLFVAAVSLCTQIASTPYGAKVLLEHGILDRINGVETLRTPPTGAGIADDPFAPARDASVRNLEEQVCVALITLLAWSTGRITPLVPMYIDVRQLFESQLIPTLSLLRTIVAVLPRHQAVLAGCAAFLTKNHQTVTAVLHLRTRTLNSLIHAESLISTMNLVLKGLRGVEHHMGDFAATFTADICHLLSYIGAAPLPPLQYTMRGAAQSSWWTDIVPISAFDRELQQTPPPANLNPLRRKEWSAFEYRKLILGIKILRHSATYLRLRCQSITEGRMAVPAVELTKEESAKKRAKTAVPPVDLEKVIVPFLVCYEEATALRPQGELDSQLWLANEDVDALGGLMDTDSVRDYTVRSLQFVLENLICVLHDTIEARQSNAVAGEGFKRALTRFVELVDSKFIPHSFLRRVGRRIKERSDAL